MAEGKLTPQQRMDLTIAIAARDWVQIAETYFELRDSEIQDIKDDNQGNAKAQSKAMLNLWLNKNPDGQVKKLADILYKAAKNYGIVNPHVVEQTLKVPRGDDGGAASGRKELTGLRKVELSQRITSNGDLNQLGISGFNLKDYIVAAALKNNNNDITQAALDVINAWSDQYEDQGEAYDDLCTIIRKIKKAAWLDALK